MKKIIAMALMVLFIISLVGCSQGNAAKEYFKAIDNSIASSPTEYKETLEDEKRIMEEGYHNAKTISIANDDLLTYVHNSQDSKTFEGVSFVKLECEIIDKKEYKLDGYGNKLPLSQQEDTIGAEYKAKQIDNNQGGGVFTFDTIYSGDVRHDFFIGDKVKIELAYIAVEKNDDDYPELFVIIAEKIN